MTPLLVEILRSVAEATVFLMVGVGAGQVYFDMLRRAAALMVAGRSARLAIALTVGRFALAAAALAVAVSAGAVPLIAMTLGIVAGRRMVMRARATAS